MLRQRVYGIGCGHEDCNDAARLRCDRTQRLRLDRDPLSSQELASQPTLSSCENGVDHRAPWRMGYALAERVIEWHRRRLGRRVKRVTIDLDGTDD